MANEQPVSHPVIGSVASEFDQPNSDICEPAVIGSVEFEFDQPNRDFCEPTVIGSTEFDQPLDELE